MTETSLLQYLCAANSTHRRRAATLNNSQLMSWDATPINPVRKKITDNTNSGRARMNKQPIIIILTASNIDTAVPPRQSKTIGYEQADGRTYGII
jgi:hypothetical protein